MQEEGPSKEQVERTLRWQGANMLGSLSMRLAKCESLDEARELGAEAVRVGRAIQILTEDIASQEEKIYATEFLENEGNTS